MNAKARFVPDAFPRRRAGKYLPRLDTSGSRSREAVHLSPNETDDYANSFNVHNPVSNSQLSSTRSVRPSPSKAKNAGRAKLNHGL